MSYMNTAPTLLFETETTDNLIQFPNCEQPKNKTNGTSSKIPHPADPIRDREIIKQIRSDLLAENKLMYYALFTCGITFGIRAGDLLSLTIGDVSNVTRCMKPDLSKEDIKDCIDIWEKKTGKHNKVHIPDIAKEALAIYLRTRFLRATDPLFKSRQNPRDDSCYKAITIQRLHQFMKSLGKRYNIPGNISTHTLRKTFVYQLITDPRTTSKQLVTIQQMLNHSSFQTTLRYCGIEDEDKQELRDYLNDIF